MTAAGRVHVVDGFLPDAGFAALLQALTDPSFPWEDSQVLSPAAALAAGLAEADNRQRVHGFLLNRRDVRVASPQLAVVAPVMERLGAARWFKVKANLTPRSQRPITYGLHVDVRRAGAITSILYLNGNDGGTLFDDGTRVASVANRLALFDAAIPHTGVSCTDAPWRLVLNLNFLPGAAGTVPQRV